MAAASFAVGTKECSRRGSNQRIDANSNRSFWGNIRLLLTPETGTSLRSPVRPDGSRGITAFGKLAPDHVMANADFLLDVGERPALGPHLQHYLQFLRRKGHASRDLGIRKLPAVLRPAGIGGNIRPLSCREFAALLL